MAGEETLVFQCRAMGLPMPEREHRFHPKRRWRFDLAWPKLKVAAEVEGGVWSKGRHTRPQGFINDCEKYNEAALLGWRVLRFPTEIVNSGRAVLMLERALVE